MDDAHSLPKDDQGKVSDSNIVGQPSELTEGVGDLEEVLAAARPRLMRLARMQGVASDAIEDVVQETLVEAWRHLDRLRTPERFHAWLDGICRNVCLRWSSTQRKYLLRRAVLPDPFAETTNEEDFLDQGAIDPAEELSQQELPILLGRALSYLPEGVREIVELYYLAGIPQRVIAARLNLTLTTLEVRLVRARRQLRHILSTQLRADAEAFGLILDRDTKALSPTDAVKQEHQYVGYFLVEGENNHMNGIDHFDRFTEPAKVVIEMAQDEAQHFGHDALGSEHILLGLIREGKSVAARVLESLGMTLEKVRQAVEEVKGRGSRGAPGEMGLTPHANTVIEMVMREAERQFPSRSTEPEEQLIGSIHLSDREVEKILQDSKVPAYLESLGVTLEQVSLAVEEAKGRGVQLLFDQRSPANTPTEQAERRRHPFFRITTENLLLGLLHVPESRAVKILQELGGPPLKDFGSLVFLEQVTTLQTANQGYIQRFTRQARKAWALAHEESRRLKDGYVGAHHLLLGLVAEGGGVAATVLAEMGIELSQIREQFKPSYEAGSWNVPGSIKLQPKLKYVIELASNEARRLNHRSLGTGHLLLALVRGEGIETATLELLGVDLDKLHIALRNMQSEELGLPGQDGEAVTDPISEEGVYAYDASIASIEKDLQSRELDKTLLAAYPFSIESRRVLEDARLTAKNLAQRVGPEHLLVGLASLTFGKGLVSKVFKDLGIHFAKVRAAVENRQDQGWKTASVVLVQNAMCRACLLMAVDEAEQRDGLGAPIRSEHLLLGLLREEKGTVADVLLDLGTSVKVVRAKLLEALGDAGSQGGGETGN